MSLSGLQVLSLESRRAQDMKTLILREEGIPFIAPSVREKAVEGDGTSLDFLARLEAGEFEMVVCMTSVGLEMLRDAIARHYPVERLGEALRRTTIISRGPKPVGILRSMGVPIHLIIPEPNTWQEIVTAVEQRGERRIAVQEYGRSNVEMYRALERAGATVTPFSLYRWELPEDIEPLREAARLMAARRFDLVLFTTSVQLDHLALVARELGQAGEVEAALREYTVIGSIGPVMTATLEARGYLAEIVPRHPKMWALVKAASQEALSAIQTKRSRLSGRNVPSGGQA